LSYSIEIRVVNSCIENKCVNLNSTQYVIERVSPNKINYTSRTLNMNT